MTDAREVLNIDARTVQRLLPFGDLVAALRAAFAAPCVTPARHLHEVPHEAGRNTLFLMPAWNDRYMGLKVAVVAPANAQAGLPSLSSTYMLCDKRTGAALAIIDGAEITSYRTAAASALAASFLARRDAATLLVAGTGRIASLLPAAYRAVLPIRRVLVWSRTAQRAVVLCEQLARDGFECAPCFDLEQGMKVADAVSCATQADRIVVQGRWLRPGMFVDLIGSFQPHTREADDETVKRSKVVVDTEEALVKSGDLVVPIREGAWSATNLHATLGDLCKGTIPGRSTAEEIFFFKSVGTALEDLAAAQLVYERCPGSHSG